MFKIFTPPPKIMRVFSYRTPRLGHKTFLCPRVVYAHSAKPVHIPTSDIKMNVRRTASKSLQYLNNYTTGCISYKPSLVYSVQIVRRKILISIIRLFSLSLCAGGLLLRWITFAQYNMYIWRWKSLSIWCFSRMLHQSFFSSLEKKKRCSTLYAKKLRHVSMYYSTRFWVQSWIFLPG